jgi:protein-export membrane protein SecD
MVHIPRWQIGLVLALLLAGLVFAAPNLLGRQTSEELPGWLPSKQINLGLDLRGGSYLLLEAELESVIVEHLENLADGLRRELRRAKIDHTPIKVQGAVLRFTLSDVAARDQVRNVVVQLSDQFQVTTTDAGSVELVFTDLALTALRNNIMEQAIEIVRIRLDETGTREPTIQRQGDRRILVQLPGVDDPERIKEILGQTAKLTFRFVLREVVPGRDPIPRGAEVLPSKDANVGGGVPSYVVKKRVMVSGENLVDAQGTFQDNRWSASASIRSAPSASPTPPRRTSASCSRSSWTAR